MNAATLLLSVYGTWAIAWGAYDLARLERVETWAAGAVIAFGLLLLLGSVIARVRIPGGLPIVAAALLGLQALDVHNASHLGTPLPWQWARALVSALLMAAAFYGGLPHRRRDAGQ